MEGLAKTSRERILTAAPDKRRKSTIHTQRLPERILAAALFDTSGFAGKLAQVEDARAANLSDLVHFDLLDVGRVKWKYTFHTRSVADLANREGLGTSGPFALDNVPPKRLGPGLVAFNDTVVNGNVVAGFEYGNLAVGNQGFFEFFDQFHVELLIG